MQSAGLSTSSERLDALQVEENSTYPVRLELDDEPITDTTEVISSQLRTCPHSFTLTLLTFSTAAYGLLLLSIRQARWTTSIPYVFIPTTITQLIRQSDLHQIPPIIRANAEFPVLSRDACNITSLAFAGHRPTKRYRIFRASALYTTLKLITATKYRYQHERTSSAIELSPTLQSLLHVLDVVQPATQWMEDERPNTTTLTPLYVDYNPVRLQYMSCSIYLTHLDNPVVTNMYLIRPPRPSL
jgi:hypothetical protein